MNKHSGFTLFELIISLALLTFLLGQLVLYMAENRQGIVLNKESIVAHSAANEIIEQLLSVPFEDLADAVYEDGQLADGNPLVSSGSWKFKLANNDGFQRRVEIASVLKNDLVQYKKISVEIAWDSQEKPGQKKNYRMIALYTKETTQK